MMLLRIVILFQVFCGIQQAYAGNVSSSASPTAVVNASVVSNETSTIASLPSISVSNTNASTPPDSQQQTLGVSPSTSSSSQQATSASKNVQDLLDQANKILADLNKKTSSGGSSPQKGTCDGLDWSPDMSCSDTKCSEAYIEKINNLFKCTESKPENVSSLDLVNVMQKAGMLMAKDVMAKVKGGAPNNITYTKALENFVVVSGVVVDDYINNTKDEFVKLPDYSDPSSLTGKWETMRDSISIPIVELKKKPSSYWPYVVSVHSNLVEDRPLTMTEIETDFNELIKESDISELYLDGNELKSRKKTQRTYINTNVFSFSFERSFTGMENPMLITLRHKKVDSLERPACVYWDTINSIWSKKGCSVQETNSTHTICACRHLTAFAVAMKEKNVEDLSMREILVTVAFVLGSISLILLVACAVCIFVVGYHFVDNMRIALNLDVALILCHLFFFAGISSSASKYIATPATCKVISPFVHMFELAALSFLLMEGLHYVDKFKPLFSKKNTRTFYIYVALGWGIPIAFSAAVAGYTYKHHGSPIRNEFCWMSVYGDDAWYFGTPVLILAILNLIVRVFVLKDVMAWKGDPNHVNIERTKMRLISAMVLLPVIILAWVLGILATNHSERKEFHYFFVIFHALQGILVFVFYCARNTEMWAYYKEQKESNEAEKNAVYTFHYVP